MPRASIKWPFCLSHIRPCCYISHHRAEALSTSSERDACVLSSFLALSWQGHVELFGRYSWNHVRLHSYPSNHDYCPWWNSVQQPVVGDSISNYLYGINTLLMVLRVSSILELSPTIGPLQLALYRMCGDLLIILSQYCFVILGFSMAITKSYKAELSYLTPPSYSGQSVGKSMEWVCFWSLDRYHYTLNKHFLVLLGSNPRDTERYQYLVGTKSYLVQPVSCVEPS